MNHPWVGTAFCAGLLLGALFCLPLVPYELPDSAASLLGAAAGAAAAVFGAAWYTAHRDRRREATNKVAIMLVSGKALRAVNDLAEELERTRLESPNQQHLSVFQAAVTANLRLESYAQQLDELRPLFVELGGLGIIAFGTYRDCTGSLRQHTTEAIELHRAARNGYAERRDRLLEKLRSSIEVFDGVRKSLL